MQVAKWGNSLAIRLPVAVVDALGLKEGDDIDVVIADKRLMGIEKTPDRLELLKQLRKYRGLIPADFKFDRDEANER